MDRWDHKSRPMAHSSGADYLVENLRRGVPLNHYDYKTRRAAYDALKELSGQDFGYDTDAWRQWIIDNKLSISYFENELVGYKYIPDPLDTTQVSRLLETYDAAEICLLAKGQDAKDTRNFSSKYSAGSSAFELVDQFSRMGWYRWLTAIDFGSEPPLRYRLGMIVKRLDNDTTTVLIRLHSYEHTFDSDFTALLFDEEDEPPYWKEVVRLLEKHIFQFMVTAAQHYISTHMDGVCPD